MTAREVHLTTAELAAREGVSVATVYAWNSQGTGPVRLKSGPRSPCRYRLADVEAWEASRAVQPARMTAAQAARSAA